MDPSVAIQFIVLIVLLLLSAFFSSAETSLVTVNQIRMRSLADEGNKKAAPKSDDANATSVEAE